MCSELRTMGYLWKNNGISESQNKRIEMGIICQSLTAAQECIVCKVLAGSPAIARVPIYNVT